MYSFLQFLVILLVNYSLIVMSMYLYNRHYQKNLQLLQTLVTQMTVQQQQLMDRAMTKTWEQYYQLQTIKQEPKNLSTYNLNVDEEQELLANGEYLAGIVR